jgi:hypothetical protein
MSKIPVDNGSSRNIPATIKIIALTNIILIETSVHELEQHRYLLAVSDGPVKFHDMIFGWVLATPTCKRLAAAAGPCDGRGNSLQAEGAGMLSVTMFTALIKHYLKIETMKIVFISDNSELIRRLKVHKHYDEPFPNETLKSEFDVTEQIYRTTTTYGIQSTYKWGAVIKIKMQLMMTLNWKHNSMWMLTNMQEIFNLSMGNLDH